MSWLRLWIGIPVALALVAALYSILKPRTGATPAIHNGFMDVVIDRKYIVSAIFLFCYVIFAGIGEFYFQMSDDAFYRNGIFRELINRDWPVVYGTNENLSILCYFFGFWLPSALIAMIFGNSILIGNIALVLYTYWGLMILFNFIYSHFEGRVKYKILAVFFLFSAWDLILSGYFLYWPGNSLSDWQAFLRSDQNLAAPGYATNNIYTLFFDNFNSTIPAFVGCFLAYYNRNTPRYLFLILSLIAICSPFAMVGLVLPAILYLSKNFHNALSWQNILSILIFCLVGLFFITNNNAHAESVESGSHYTIPELVESCIVFVIFAYGIYLPWIWKSVRKDILFSLLFINMAIVPLLCVGYSVDLGWRAGMPFSLYFLMKVTKKVLSVRKWSKPYNALFLIVLIIGSISPVSYYTLTLAYPLFHATGHDGVIATFERICLRDYALT